MTGGKSAQIEALHCEASEFAGTIDGSTGPYAAPSGCGRGSGRMASSVTRSEAEDARLVFELAKDLGGPPAQERPRADAAAAWRSFAARANGVGGTAYSCGFSPRASIR